MRPLFITTVASLRVVPGLVMTVACVKEWWSGGIGRFPGATISAEVGIELISIAIITIGKVGFCMGNIKTKVADSTKQNAYLAKLFELFKFFSFFDSSLCSLNNMFSKGTS